MNDTWMAERTVYIYQCKAHWMHKCIIKEKKSLIFLGTWVWLFFSTHSGHCISHLCIKRMFNRPVIAILVIMKIYSHSWVNTFYYVFLIHYQFSAFSSTQTFVIISFEQTQWSTYGLSETQSIFNTNILKSFKMSGILVQGL